MKDASRGNIPTNSILQRRGLQPHAIRSPTGCAARSLGGHGSSHSFCTRDVHASFRRTAGTPPAWAHPGADAGGGYHGGGAKLSSLVRRPLICPSILSLIPFE